MKTLGSQQVWRKSVLVKLYFCRQVMEGAVIVVSVSVPGSRCKSIRCFPQQTARVPFGNDMAKLGWKV
jgi:hypothetical protein